MKCEHKNLKYFELSNKVICLDCGCEWFKIDCKVSEDIKNTILTMRSEGKTFNEIGKTVGISRQRVFQIYKLIK